MNPLNIYITTIFILKLVFIGLSMANVYFTHIGQPDERIQFWRDRCEFIFIILMSLLLIYLFDPRVNHLHLITHEAKILLTLFGVILILTAKWEYFLQSTPWFQRVLGTGTR